MADENFYNKQLGISYWYVTRKPMIKKIISIIFIVLIIIFLAFNLYLLIFNLGIYGRAYKAFLNSLATVPQEYINLRQNKLPQALKVNQIVTLANAENYDIMADISNPNEKWYATFDYQFQINDSQTPAKAGFILPGKNIKLIDLQIENGNQVSNLVFSDLKWYKEINFSALEAEKLNIETKNISFITAAELGVGDKVQISRVKFDAVNNSPFNYADVNFQIYLLSGGQIVAVNQIHSGILNSSQTKTYEVNFFQTLGKITEVSIVPEINILDPNAFSKF
jgi:hypothetical protein